VSPGSDSQPHDVNERIVAARKLVHEHLNASMIMVPLELPIDPTESVADVLGYLEDNGFDLAILDGRDLRIVYRDRLRSVPEPKRRQRVTAYSDSPRAGRLVEHTLDLGEVAERLIDDPVPLLVVGRNGPEHIVTRSDFTRPAGQAGILAVIAVLDAMLDVFLQPHDHEVWARLTRKRRSEIDELVGRARRRDAEVPRLGYLSLRERFEAVRRLCLDRRYRMGLGNEEGHNLVVATRNDIAHGREVKQGLAAMRALVLAEDYLDGLVEREPRLDFGDFDPIEHLGGLVGAELRTLTGRPNRILEVAENAIVVATGRSPQGRPVPTATVEEAINRLIGEGEVVIDVRSVGYRSAFIGAVLVTLPGAFVDPARPRVVQLPDRPDNR
jgi:hypothetical protein